MQLVTQTYSQRYEVKKSVFISYLTPISEFDSLIKTLKIEHPKASHIIYAYRKLNEFDQIVENSSDDGEPKGCAGAPTLSVLRGEKIINSALITVRYFGGTKLGTGGMIRGYGTGAKEVIKSAEFKIYEKRFSISFETLYALVNRYEHYFNHENITYPTRDFRATTVLWELDLTEEEIKKFKIFKQNL
ncbi:MAG TPA: YigZ family protein [Campylobacterales bacterium]|nr:YigZ family protein [Campylobacterales bacterium]